MNTLREAKKQYEEIPIPEELSERVNQEIRRGNQRRGRKLLFARFWKGTAAAAARYKNKNANADFGRGASNIIFYSLHFDNRYPNC